MASEEMFCKNCGIPVWGERCPICNRRPFPVWSEEEFAHRKRVAAAIWTVIFFVAVVVAAIWAF